ncbi:MAG TPA: hypothetical protein VGM03_20210 [Phycisphaerae bacterium]|jgi:hypothetical protein
MLIDRTQRPWIAFTLSATLLTGAVYVYAARRDDGPPSGGTWFGLGFGLAAYALMLFAGLLAVRKRFPTLRVGRVQTWTAAHVWLGLLALPLALYHAGFQARGALTLALLVLLCAVVVSGVFGLLMQNLLPRMMTERVPLEVSFENIPNFLEQRCRYADDLVGSVCGPIVEEHTHPTAPNEYRADGLGRGPALLHHAAVAKSLTIAAEPTPGSEPLRDFYLHEVRPFLLGGKHYAGNVRGALTTLFGQMNVVSAPQFHPLLATLHEICEERRQLLLQKRLHAWLHNWLLLHVPLAVCLLVLGALHALASLRY